MEAADRARHPASAGETRRVKRRKVAKTLPKVSKSEAESLPKTEAVLLRLTKQDKATIAKVAGKLHLTMTEYLTKSALLVAEKVR
jgi:hypothetical protein